jgi:hypothetical protein
MQAIPALAHEHAKSMRNLRKALRRLALRENIEIQPLSTTLTLAAASFKLSKEPNNDFHNQELESFRFLEKLLARHFYYSSQKQPISEAQIKLAFKLVKALPLVPHLKFSTFLSDLYEVTKATDRANGASMLQTPDKMHDPHIVAQFTQVFTPPWVVEHLIKRNLSKALEECPTLEELQTIRFLEPACGTGNFLGSALNCFYDAYLRFGHSPGQAMSDSLKHNLHGADIEASALEIAHLVIICQVLTKALDPKLLEATPPHLILLNKDAAIGSIVRNLPEPLAGKFQVILTNPPYIGRKLLPRELKEKLAQEQSEFAQDLSSAFLASQCEKLSENGRLGVITQNSFAYLPSGKKLRTRLLRLCQIEEIIDLGRGVFPLLAGEKASVSLLSLKRGQSLDHAPCTLAQSSQDGSLTRKCVSQSDLKRKIESGFNFHLPPLMEASFKEWPKLGELALLKQGLATTDNKRFVRQVWQLSDQDRERFVPYAMGNGNHRYFRSILSYVLWQEDGAQIKEAVLKAYPYLNGNYAWVVKNQDFYFKSGLTFSFVNKNSLAVRLLPSGCIFDVGGSAIFPLEEENRYFLLAYLNSTWAQELAVALNPTINFQVGNLKHLPVLPAKEEEKAGLIKLAQEAVEIAGRLEMMTSPVVAWQKTDNTWVKAEYAIYEQEYQKLSRRLNEIEEAIDELVLTQAKAFLHFNPEEETEIRSFLENHKRKSASVSQGKDEFTAYGLVYEALTGQTKEISSATIGHQQLETFLKRTFSGTSPFKVK